MKYCVTTRASMYTKAIADAAASAGGTPESVLMLAMDQVDSLAEKIVVATKVIQLNQISVVDIPGGMWEVMSECFTARHGESGGPTIELLREFKAKAADIDVNLAAHGTELDDGMLSFGWPAGMVATVRAFEASSSAAKQASRKSVLTVYFHVKNPIQLLELLSHGNQDRPRSLIGVTFRSLVAQKEFDSTRRGTAAARQAQKSLGHTGAGTGTALVQAARAQRLLSASNKAVRGKRDEASQKAKDGARMKQLKKQLKATQRRMLVEQLGSEKSVMQMAAAVVASTAAGEALAPSVLPSRVTEGIAMKVAEAVVKMKAKGAVAAAKVQTTETAQMIIGTDSDNEDDEDEADNEDENENEGVEPSVLELSSEDDTPPSPHTSPQPPKPAGGSSSSAKASRKAGDRTPDHRHGRVPKKPKQSGEKAQETTGGASSKQTKKSSKSQGKQRASAKPPADDSTCKQAPRPSSATHPATLALTPHPVMPCALAARARKNQCPGPAQPAHAPAPQFSTGQFGSSAIQARLYLYPDPTHTHNPPGGLWPAASTKLAMIILHSTHPPPLLPPPICAAAPPSLPHHTPQYDG